ncbi:MAG: HipA N-terminal domain-containing protein [bacterium]|nr:HipA N-terminal domain-containing protein [bacterium]
MKKAIVYNNDEVAGTLEKNSGGYVFQYTDAYFTNTTKKSISITLSKTKQEHRSKILFPFFFNMLSEGVNKQLQCRHLKIDENDYFSLLLAIGNRETIGAVYVKPEQE